MTALQGSPRFTGFIRRLVDEGHISAENMQQAMLSAKKPTKISSLILSVKLGYLVSPLLKLSLLNLLNLSLILVLMTLAKSFVKV